MSLLLTTLLLACFTIINANFPIVNDSISSVELTRVRRVVNGDDVHLQNWKFLVSILHSAEKGDLRSRIGTYHTNRSSEVHDKRDKYYTAWCGGSVLTPTLVLTAGHCVVDHNVLEPASNFLVRAGSHRLSTADIDSEVEDIEIEKIILHNNFNESRLKYGNDLAVLKLKQPIHLSPNIALAALPPPGIVYPAGTNCLAAGWGQTESGKMSDVAKEVDIPVYDMAKCSKDWQLPKNSTNGKLICAIGSDWQEDTCNGDSGGPLVCKLPSTDSQATEAHASGKWLLSGIVSFGSAKCAKKDSPGMYTSVSYHMPWIRKIIEEYDA